jgi:regulatory protein YycI of two-component signal transduction system YycFG
MEWGRAKTILIASFLILNMLLFSQLRDSTQNMATQNLDMTEFNQQVRNLMTSKNIEVRATMPIFTEDLKQINVIFQESDMYAQKIKLNNPLINGLEVNTNPFHEALEQKIDGLDMTQFVYDSQLSTKEKIVYHQLFEGLPMFEVNFLVYQENKRVVAYELDRVTIEPLNEQNLITSYAAVSNLIENYLPDNVAVVDVQLGYHGQLFNSQKQFLTPFWRVMLDDGMQYYVHAINGAVETPIEKENIQ